MAGFLGDHGEDEDAQFPVVEGARAAPVMVVVMMLTPEPAIRLVLGVVEVGVLGRQRMRIAYVAI